MSAVLRFGKGDPRGAALLRAQSLLAMEIARLQAADTAYWSPIVAELRVLRRSRGLLAVGSLLS